MHIFFMVPGNKEINHEDLARWLWTIGDINRLRILTILPDSPACEHKTNVSQIAEKLGMSQPTVSNHLARLRTLGIVKHKRVCRDVLYWIDQDRANEVIEQLELALKVVNPPEE